MVDLTCVLSEALPFVGWRYGALMQTVCVCSLLAQGPDEGEGTAHPGNSHCDPPSSAPLSSSHFARATLQFLMQLGQSGR